MAWATGPASAGADVAGRSRLLYAEPINSTWQMAPQSGGSAGGTPAEAALRFRAFGRTFDVRLARHGRLAAPAPGFEPQRGALRDLPGSWARVTRRGHDLIGLLFDGQEYFGIEPAAALAGILDPAVTVPAGANLIYRLSDLILDVDGLACGVQAPGGPRASAATSAEALADELAAPGMAAAVGPDYRIVVAPVADYEFVSRYGANALSEIIARLNIADGIFSEQAGIDLVAGSPVLFASVDGDYPFDATQASGLLNQLSDYRLANHAQAGLSHLFTNKTFANRVVGLAWQAAVCFPRESAGVSTSAGITAITSALVTAHEIGHNFGAPHDGESGSACAATPTTFLMAARSSGSSVFSACSLGQMAPVVAERAAAYPTCLTSIADYDVGLFTPARAQADPAEPLELVLVVQNLGSETAMNVQLQVSTPSPLLITGITGGAGFCDFASTDAICDLPSLPSGEAWQVTVQVQGDQERIYDVTASVTAAVDGATANNAATIPVTVGDPPVAAASSSGGGGGGGGGGLDALALLALGLAGARRGLTASRRGRSVAGDLPGECRA